MSRLARAIEILEAINEQFNEGAECVYRDGLILSDDSTLQDAVAECVGDTSEPLVPVIPHSQRRHYGKNWYGDFVGFIGDHKVIDFGDNKEAAIKWVNE